MAANNSTPSPLNSESPIAREPEADLRTRLLTHRTWDQASACGSDSCNHGTLSPRPPTRGSVRTYGSVNSDSVEDPYGDNHYAHAPIEDSPTFDSMGAAIAAGLLRSGTSKISTTAYLARMHGVKNRRLMFLAYYFPFLNWVRQYKWSYLRGDLVAALTMASFYIPMSLSLAANLGHIPPINGMYAFVFNPLIYALLGTCPQMVVGPEAAGSLLTGTVVKDNIERGLSSEEGDIAHAHIAGVVTTTAGAFIFLAGITRLGFLDSVLSRPFLRGFISAIGFVIFFDQLIPELGLQAVAKEVGGVSHGSVVDKLRFIVTHLNQAHGLTAAVSLGAFALIMACRWVSHAMPFPCLPTRSISAHLTSTERPKIAFSRAIPRSLSSLIVSQSSSSLPSLPGALTGSPRVSTFSETSRSATSSLPFTLPSTRATCVISPRPSVRPLSLPCSAFSSLQLPLKVSGRA